LVFPLLATLGFLVVAGFLVVVAVAGNGKGMVLTLVTV
jgi:hypothetical protein